MKINDLDKALNGFGRLLILVAGIIALFSVKERLYLDSSYYFFHTLNEGFPRIDHDRFVLALAESPILFGRWLGMSIDSIATLYSVGHVLIFLILHQVVVKRYGQWRHGLLIGMMMFFGLSHLFFSPMLELWYGLILLVVLDARIIHHGGLRPPQLFWTAVLALLILTSHPECFIPFLLLILLRRLTGELSTADLFGFVSLMAAVACFKFLTFSTYEGGKVSNSLATGSYLDRLTDVQAYARMARMFVLHYGLIIALAGVGIWGHWIGRGRRQAVLILLFLIGFLLFIRVTIGSSTYGRYNQSVFLPFVFMCCYLFISGWPYLRQRWVKWVGAVLLLVCGLKWVSETVYLRAGLSERVAHIETSIDVARENGGKLIISEIDSERFPEKRSYSWSVSIESLLFSTMDGGTPVSVVTDWCFESEDNDGHLDQKKFILTPWVIMTVSDLDPDYFVMGEGEYVKRSE